VLAKEETRFAETLDQGMEILESAIADLDGKQLPGDVVFKLYDTYGFPVDLTADIARERDLSVDEKGFEEAMDAQRERARASSKFGVAGSDELKVDSQTEFLGYAGTEGTSEVLALFRDGAAVDKLDDGDEGAVVLASTPFYAESGGQIGDTGILVSDRTLFRVDDTQKSGDANVHFGSMEQGQLKLGDTLEAVVDAERRQAIRLNHTATHLMHAALRQVLGDHVTQKGSLVAPDRLRFDFSHYEGVTSEQLQEIEDLVNAEIRKNLAADTNLMTYDDAIDSGAMALFGEKYGDKVRVLRLGNFSVELCGGTHVERTGDIGVFKITHEGGVASGVRRIEAVTGSGALAWIDANQRTLTDLAGMLRSTPEQAAAKVEQLLRHNKDLEKKLATAKHALITGQASDHEDNVHEIGGIKVVASRMDGVDAKALREAVDRVKNTLGNAVVVLGSVDDGKVRLAAGVTRNNTDRIRAGDLIKPVAEQVGGKGGGRPDFAQAGGTDASKLDSALESVLGWVADQLS
jgi:alanyl-tRNA synthetase